jgi:hypothetical protein
MLDTLIDSLRSPLGTARLLEGFSTLSRADKAGVSPQQMRAVFSDLKGHSDEQIRGFVGIGQKLVSGEARFAGTALTPSSDTAKPAPKPR